MLLKHRYRLGGVALSVIVLTSVGWSQGVDVSAHIEVTPQQEHGHSHASPANAVLWLTSTRKSAPDVPAQRAQGYTLVQKNKKFSPHILVVPTGSSVDFPNLDPFFHNVFSLYNGKRFDLGLYEAHTHRTVQFDREGVSYIFCNIHPEMGAVVVTLSTPYYGISNANGTVVIRNVPPGSYRMNVWAENVDNNDLNALSRIVEINSQGTQLGILHLNVTDSMIRHHKNKFGEAYPPASKDAY